ncbi:hypothetical protein [Solirubrobacter soli]|uniref:hypothetical protein n=1 Tax=Solirubrobacter soli TaxID=363832 RepID=UPI0004069E91|nr:hypothetical protein [Solirubrobacter soli]
MKLLILAVLLLGCGSDVASAATLKGTLKYSRNGGFAGVSESASIAPSGKATFKVSKRRTTTLTHAERSRLARYAEAADIPHAKVPKGSKCCDTYAYDLTYRGRTLRWYDGGKVPKALATLVGELNRLVKKHGGGLG